MTEHIDNRTLVSLVNEHSVNPMVAELTVHQISGLFWAYRNLGSLWDSATLELIEERLSKLIR